MMTAHNTKTNDVGGNFFRAIIAVICFMAMMISGAVHSTHAQAANGTLTIKAGDGSTLVGHTFNVYLLATYTDVVMKNATTVQSVSAKPSSDATSKWISIALKAAGIAVDTAKGQNPAERMLKQTTGSQATRVIAATLADNVSGHTAAKANQTSTAASLTLTLTEGYYLVTDSAGLPIIASTTVQGAAKTATDSTLGTVYMKDKVATPKKEIKRSDGTWHDSAGVTNGETREFRVRITLPNKLAAKTITLTDAMTGMQYVGGTFKAKISAGKNVGKDVTSEFGTVGKLTSGDGFKVTSKETLISGYDTQQVEITYSSKITDVAKAKKGSNTVKVSIGWQPGIDPPGENPPGDTVDVLTFDINLKKISAASTSQSVIPVAGAKFVIKNETLKKWMNWDDKTKQWTYVDSADKAQRRTTDANGFIGYARLGAGTYLVSEVEVPQGYFSLVKPSFRVTITDEGVVSIVGVDQSGLTTAVSKADGKATTPVATVKNVNNMSQLPMTGGTTIGAMSACGLFVLGIALFGGLQAGRTRRDGMDQVWRS